MCIGNVDNDASGDVKIVVGSFQGVVKAYEHALGEAGAHFTAYNMVCGAFGGVERDLIAVQSMDGRLQVFEQDAHAFTRRLGAAALLPGPLCYVARTDSIVTATSDLCLECYRYQALAAPAGGGGGGGAGGAAGGRAPVADWSLRLGEGVRDLFVAKYSGALGPNSIDIVAVGEQTLFVVKEHGALRSHKLLDFTPAAAAKYVTAAGDPTLLGRDVSQASTAVLRVHCYCWQDVMGAHVASEGLLLATHEGRLLVYRGAQLVWGARMAAGRAPVVALAVAALGGTAGMIVALDDAGQLDVLYLGTDPPAASVAAPDDAKELDYAAMDAEHRRLLQIIRRSQAPSLDAPEGPRLTIRAEVLGASESARLYTARCQAPSPPEKCSAGSTNGAAAGFLTRLPACFSPAAAQAAGADDDDDSDDGGGDGAPDDADGPQHMKPPVTTVQLHISYSGAEAVRGAALSVALPVGLCFAAPPPAELPPIPPSTSAATDGAAGAAVTVRLRIRAHTDALPDGLDCEAVVVAHGSGGGGGGGVRTARAAFRLPLAAVCMPAAAAAKAAATAAGAAAAGDADFKLTLDTNRGPVPVATLFGDVLETAGEQRGGAVVLALWPRAAAAAAGPPTEVTLLVSKSAGRYRIQSRCLPAMWVVAEELVRRLNAQFGGGAKGDAAARPGSPPAAAPFAVAYGDPLPLQDVFAAMDERFSSAYAARPSPPLLGTRTAIDAHAADAACAARPSLLAPSRSPRRRWRQELARALSELNDAAHQFRVIEKRLLVRFKAQHAQAGLRRAGTALACCLQLLCMLARLRFALDARAAAALAAHLRLRQCAACDDGGDAGGGGGGGSGGGGAEGWEEAVDAGMVHLLRTSLAKTASEEGGAGGGGGGYGAPPADTEGLKKHLGMVLDRLSKGAQLLLPQKAALRTPPPPDAGAQEHKGDSKDNDSGGSMDGER
ncbi:Bardet-Biedl syndrome 9, parathyroid hormone-responsive B1 [Tribonema minus]|uniref:Bardet-Biedl syndrome 9, parathyroid hormone-responsive B1 n=1 Tax=Tribonema minus TaxID=303371 RepID=A0A835YK73_9STRA|nr:Bardet-Biedl syndrome 9, parathyroid hormone-responsive B1 [Tribonema minus]